MSRVQPRVGHMVRIDDDSGTGTTGAIAKVQAAYDHHGEPAVTLFVGGVVVHLLAKGVTPVTYDSETRTWSEVTQ